MFKRRLYLVLIALIAFTVVGLTGCNGAEDGEDPVKIIYSDWSCSIAASHVVAEVLESKLGYDVELVPVASNVFIWESLANGIVDATVSAWLPVTDGELYAIHGDNIENLGPNMAEADVGLVLPQYVTIDSVEELNDYRDQFGGKIIGIEAGTGIMNDAERAIAEYSLDFELVESSDAAMTAYLESAVENEEWVVITGWSPHWKFGRYDLKFLEEPKEAFTETEHIDTVVRLGLKEDHPELYDFLDKVFFEPEELAQAMDLAQEEGATDESAAAIWVELNEELVESWLP